MDKRSARRLASAMLAAAARRLGSEVRHTGHAPADRTRIEDAFAALAEEMDGRAGTPAVQPPDPDQFPLFDTPREAGTP